MYSTLPLEGLNTVTLTLVQPKAVEQHMTGGGHSLPHALMLKVSPGSKINHAPCSAIELLKGSLTTGDSPAGRCCLYREMEHYG